MALFANVIVDISLEKLDKTFQYLVPEELEGQITEGVQVDISFGNRRMTGYVLELTDHPRFDLAKTKPLLGIHKGSVAVEAKLISLAGWMKRNYGSTMNQALKTVIPIKKQVKAVTYKTVKLAVGKEEAFRQLALFESKKNMTARARLVRELLKYPTLDYALVTQKLNVSPATIRSLETQHLIETEVQTTYRNPISHLEQNGYHLVLNHEQQAVVDTVWKDWEENVKKTYVLKGVTGSGKTEVYMELIARVIARGKEAILLIPEIALTYQTVMRFYQRFGDLVSIMNSTLSQGEKYDQFERAKAGDIKIMIGPRSALFTPFSNLGLIIIDEEHETSYKSENVPRYHAREVAIEIARMHGASVILGSATPSVESYYRAKQGEYELLELKNRVQHRELPSCEVVDLREELKQGNRSMLSLRLQELMEDRLNKKQQVMLFLNRRGIAGFVSCRSCGEVMKCPHCDVSLSQHYGNRLVCHYCGYERNMDTTCPSCGSKYIGTFKAGTQKVEEIVAARFPNARILRMDKDTTGTKDSYEKILQAFANGEADILIGTQMIVKGHDFPNVTLVGVLAADISLHASDYHSSERTFELLTQAIGRAGRGECKGEAVIQTYSPTHFAIETARKQDYEAFYEQEIAFRQMLRYPPVWNLLVIMLSSDRLHAVEQAVTVLYEILDEAVKSGKKPVQLVGPADPTVARVNDIYKKVVYMKTAEYSSLVQLKDRTEEFVRDHGLFREVTVQFDFNPVNGI